MFEHFTDKALRIDDYLKLIQSLLSCPSGEEPNILNANRELLDAGLVQVMEQAAVVMAEKGYQNEPRFLRSFAEGIAASIGYSSPISSAEIEDSLNFFLRVVNEVISSNNNPGVVFPLLIANLNKLDRHLAQILRVWAKLSFPLVTLPQAQSAALWIAGFGGLVKDFPQGDRESNLEIAIASFESSVQVLTSEDFPRQWSAIQDGLGNAYRKRIDGENSENIKKAIVCYQLALQVRTKSELPEQWAMTQFNLGQAYILYMEGDRRENLEKAIVCNENALQVYTPDQFPKEARMAQDNLEFTRQELINLGLAESPEQALQHSNRKNPEESSFVVQVLKLTLASEGDPQKIFTFLEKNLWQLNQNFIEELISFISALGKENNQADIYPLFIMGINIFSGLMITFPKGNREINLDIAIAGWKIVLPFFARSQNYDLPSEFSSLYGIIKLELGKAFYEKYENRWGELDVNLEEAIKSFEEGFAASISNNTLDRESRVSCQVKLGISYFNRNQIKGDPDDIEKAIKAYNLVVLSGCQENTLQLVQMNLGNAHCLRQGDPLKNLTAAIECYEKSLKFCKQDTDRTKWADVQINWGQAYYRRGMLGHSKGAEDIESAIECNNNALKVYNDKSKYPQRWAGLQNALGVCYSDRRKGNPADNLELSINHLEQALTVRTKEKYPYDRANTLKILGIIYHQRKRGDRPANLRQGILYLEQTLEVFTLENYRVGWAETQGNLGALYKNLAISLKHNAEYYQKAIDCLKETERVFEPQTNPKGWAIAQFELGTCYKNLGVFSQQDREINLAKSIECYEGALDVTSPQTNPFSWAEITNSLGNAYKHDGQYQKAIKCFEDTLKLHTREAFPTDYIKTLYNVGDTHGKFNQLTKAFEIYQEAIDTLETDLLYQLGTDDDAKRKLGEAWYQLYSAMVAVCLKLGKQNPEYYAKAWEYVERSKARRLVEILGQTKPDGVSEKNWKNFQDLRNQVTNEQKWIEDQEKSILLSGESLSEPGELDRRKIRLIDMKQQLNQKITDERKLADTQRVQYTLFSEIGKNLSDDHDDHTVIIQWYLLEADKKFCAFIYTLQNSQPYVWESSLEDLENLEQWYQEYFVNYISNFSQWKDKLSDRLKRLAEILHIDELLKYLPKNCQQLILIPHRYLHLLPIHALPLNDCTYLLDGYSKGISYYPSFQLLQTIQNHTLQNQKKCNFDNLFAIQNPENDLAFTGVEVETILSFFPKNSTVLAKEKATKTNFDYDKLPSTHCCHFACHGEFNYESPLDSALRLANNERLTLADIFELNLHQCRLVTLSACETGLTDFTSITDEYIGLASGFLYAGASTVVSSLWAVSDISTAFLFIKFYENLKNYPELKGGNVVVALQDAQNWLRNLTCKEVEPELAKAQYQQAISQLKQKLSKADFFELEVAINEERDRLQSLEPDYKPFNAPFYWAAFIATGV